MTKPRICAFRLILFFLSFTYLHGQTPSYWSITEEQGLPNNTVYRIVQDASGFIWIATADGLCRFDGKEYDYFTHPNQEDLEIIHLYLSPKNEIWFANLSNQIFFIKENQIFELKYKREAKQSFSDIIWYKNDIYILFLDKYLKTKAAAPNTNLEMISLSNSEFQGFHSNSLFVAHGKLFASCRNNVETDCFDISNHKIVKNYIPDALTGSIAEDRHYISAIGDSLLISKFRLKFYIWDPVSKELLMEHQEPLAIHQVQPVGKEVYCLAINKLEIISTEGHIGQTINLSNFEANTFFIDRENNIWIATAASGILVIPSVKMKTIVSKASKNNQIHALTNSSDLKSIWVGKEKGQFEIYNSNYKLTKRLNLPRPEKINDFYINQESLIIGNRNTYKWNQQNGTIQFFIQNAGSVKLFTTDVEGNYIFANSRNLYRIAPEQLGKQGIAYALDPDKYLLAEGRFYASTKIKDSTVWIGGIPGLFKLELESFEPVVIDAFWNLNVTSLASSNESDIWVGTRNHGLIKIENNRFRKSWQEEFGYPNNVIQVLLNDANQNLWIGTKKGLFRLDLKTEELVAINRYDGLMYDDVTELAHDSLHIWAGGLNGLIAFPKSIEVKNKIPPPIHIKKIKIGSRDTLIQSSYSLDYSQNDLEIAYVGLGYRSQGNSTYEYQLEGQDKKWIQTLNRNVQFSNLSPGDYNFKIRAINEDDIRSATIAQVSFFIHPPWWQTWWFRTLVLTGLLYTLYYFINQRLKKAAEEQEKEKKFQQKVNDLRMQAIQTQMNPHFIFNALSAIQLFLTTNDRENAMVYLARFATLIRLIFEHSKQKFIGLTEEVELLELYMDLENLRFKGKVNTAIEITEDLSLSKEEFFLPPLLLQPLVENAYKHGLLHKNNNGKIKISFSRQTTYLKCIIEDNGIGFKKAKGLNTWRTKNHSSSGLKSAYDRLEILHQNDPYFKSKNDYFKIENLNNGVSDVGTRITIMF